MAKTIEALETEKISLKQQLDDEKRKIEDLVFNYEEESITKSEIQVLFLSARKKRRENAWKVAFLFLCGVKLNKKEIREKYFFMIQGKFDF